MNMIEKVAIAINNNSIIKHSETIDEWRMRQAKKEDNIKWIAVKLELAVKDNPYLFVPETGAKAGALGLNYLSIVRKTLEIASEIKE